MQAEQLLVERDAAAAAGVYLPLFNRTLNLIESRRDADLDLFYSGDASNLLAPSYGAWLLPNGTRAPAFLTGMSVSYVAALDRVIELELLVAAADPASPWAAAAAMHDARRFTALRGLVRLLEPGGQYFVKQLDPNGTRHGVLGQARHSYIEAVANHDAVALGVAERVQPGLDEKIMTSLLGAAVPSNPKTGGPGLRPYSLVITNAGGLDDMEYDDSSWLWSFGTWVNGGEWATCEARMMLAYARTGRLPYSLDSWRALMGFASIFRMDSPLVEWGSAVYQPDDPVNIVYDMFAVGAALLRGLWDPVYSARSIVVTPHVPANITRINSSVPLLFGPFKLYLSAEGNVTAGISCVTVQGNAWIHWTPTSFTIPFDDLPYGPNKENHTIVVYFGGSACPPAAPPSAASADAAAAPPPAPRSSLDMPPLHAASSAAAARALRAIMPRDTVLWLDAAALALADGARVAAWPDAGAGPGAAQANATRQPTFRKAGMNALPAVDFDGQATFLEGALVLPPQATVVAVFNDRGETNACCTGIFYSAPGCAGMGTKTDGSGGTALMIDWSGSPDTGTDDITGRQVVASVLYNASGGYSFADGCSQSIDAGTTIPAPGGTTFMVGSRNNEDARFFNGLMSEMLVFARALNDTERGAVEAYLATKWPRAGKPLSCGPQPPNCTLPPALAAQAARLARFVDGMRGPGGLFADSLYELAHALLALESVAAWQARCAGLTNGTVQPLASRASEAAADAMYVSTAANLASGLATVLEGYAGSADPQKAAIFAIWQASAAAAGAAAAPTAEAEAAAAPAAAAPEAAAPTCRDRFLWPFDATTVWNVPIGSSAIYVDAGIYSLVDELRGLPVEIHNDQDWLIRASPSDPLVPWIDDSGNFPGMCGATGKAAPEQVPIPPTLVTDCVANNNGAGLLLPDNRTLVQMQPLYIPKAGGPIIAWYHTGAPQPFPWTIDILGNGNLGAHGGSGLSSFGGAIRLGELLPGAPPIQHALKLELFAHAYYFFNW